MATLRVILNAQPLYPELPIPATDEVIADEQRMASGQLRRWHRRTIRRFTLSRRGLSEADLAVWLAAAPFDQAVSCTDELNVTRTVVVVSRQVDLVRTQPVESGGANTTGPAFYDVTIELEEV